MKWICDGCGEEQVTTGKRPELNIGVKTGYCGSCRQKLFGFNDPLGPRPAYYGKNRDAKLLTEGYSFDAYAFMDVSFE